MAEERESTLRGILKEGCFAAFYTLNGYFLKIKAVFSIDKIEFAFVFKEDKTKSFSIYMNVDKFEDLCGQIMSGVLERKIAADTGNYPGAWKMTTGVNGAKEISIGMGQKGIVIQGRVKGDSSNKFNAFVPVPDISELRTMARWYARVSKGYYESMTAVFLEGLKEREKWHKNVEVDEDVPPEAIEPESIPAKNADQEPPKDQSNLVQLTTLSLVAPLTKIQGAYAIKIKDATGKEDVLYILPEKIGDKEADFINDASINQGIAFSCEVAELDGKKYLKRIA